jgi:membrane protein DedA with SNARE-associated domain
MTDPSEFLVRHGVSTLFLVVFVEQIGVPVPAIPMLLMAGSLAANGRLSVGAAIAASVAACLIADGIWFYLGKFGGRKVMEFLCRFALVPNTCIRRTQRTFSRYGLRGVAAAKFFRD